MRGFMRPKRVTDPLNDEVKAQLVGLQLSYVSSGSEHSAVAATDNDDDSPCLSELVHDFLEDSFECGYESDSDRVNSVTDSSSADKIDDILRSINNNNADLYKNILLTHVFKAMELFSSSSRQQDRNRKIMTFLRDRGHNAAICKTKWNSSGGLSAGNYEFIDVVQQSQSNSQNRYFIDVDFASEFEIARPTAGYARLLQSLPRVFVGKCEELKRIVKVMSDEAKKSLKSRELTLPPWRKNRYMQNKWFGPYKRTVNQIPAGSLTPILSSSSVVKCRFVGFDDGGVNGRLFVRTR